MEFFFLTQNNSTEVYILLSLGLVLIAVLSYEFYLWITQIKTVLQKPVGGYDRELTPPAPITIPEQPRIEQSISETVPAITVAEIITEEPSIIEHPSIPVAIETPYYYEEPVIITKVIPEIPVKIEKIDAAQREKLIQFISSVRTLIARGMTGEARALIVEGLSIEKNNRDLNLLLGQIYEQDGQYEKAEYVYKDLAELHSNDAEILERLANVLIIEKKYIIASEIYKKIRTLTGNTETVLYMLTHIYNMIGDHQSIVEYAKQYNLQWPKNPEIIQILANAQISLGQRKDAIETYKNLKNITPYNNEVNEILQKLLTEENPEPNTTTNRI